MAHETADLRQRTPQPETFVEARGVTKDFHQFGRRSIVRALDDVNLTVFSGKTTGLVGESGSGKSTLGDILAGLQVPTAGDVLYRNTSYARLSADEKRRLRRDVQVIFQDPVAALNPRMTVFEVVAEPFVIQRSVEYRDRKRLSVRIEELLADVGLSADIIGRRPQQLSGGQCQRLGIARALAMRPKLIICDESLSALDMPVQVAVAQLLKDMQTKYGVAYLFITHDLRMAEFMSDVIYVMHKGRVVDQGSPTYILRESVDPYVQELRNAILSIDERRFVRARHG